MAFDAFKSLETFSKIDRDNKEFELTKDLMDVQMFRQLVNLCHDLGLEPTIDNVRKVQNLYQSFRSNKPAKAPGSAVDDG